MFFFEAFSQKKRFKLSGSRILGQKLKSIWIFSSSSPIKPLAFYQKFGYVYFLFSEDMMFYGFEQSEEKSRTKFKKKLACLRN